MSEKLLKREFKIIKDIHDVTTVSLADLVQLAKEIGANYDDIIVDVYTSGYDDGWLEVSHMRKETKIEQAKRLASEMNDTIHSQKTRVWDLEKDVKDLEQTPVVVAKHKDHNKKIAKVRKQLSTAKEVLAGLLEKQQKILQSALQEED